METNQNPVQEQPVQHRETTQPEKHPTDYFAPVQEQQSAQPPSPPTTPHTPEQSAAQLAIPSISTLQSQADSPLRYDPVKAAHIAECLRELFGPSFIVLFGKLASGTPHSETFTYDLLVLVNVKSPYTWYDGKRYLKMKLPNIGHGAPYVNIYVHTQHDVEANFVPFFYFVRKEGIVLYRSHKQKFTRPRNSCDFGYAAAVAEKYTGTFLPLADRLLHEAEKMTDPMRVRLSAFSMAQAAVYYYRTLYYVYHCFEADTFDVGILQHRLRTLSGELPLLFESDEFNSLHTISCLKSFLDNARYNPNFFIHSEELEQHLDRVKRLGTVVNKLCERRIALYEKRAK